MVLVMQKSYKKYFLMGEKCIQNLALVGYITKLKYIKYSFYLRKIYKN